MSVKANITNIARCSLHDGPGVRTVVYLKGCGLRCKWCHNPETLSFSNQIIYNSNKCIKCGKCIEVCPEHHTIRENEMMFNREGCELCGKCVDICPASALSFTSKEMTCEEVFSEIIKDGHYYKSSGGGVTFSGGECLLNPEFIEELSKMCKENGIHTAVESAFYVPFENAEKVFPYIDLFFADLKIPDSVKHKEYTGKDNTLIIENIRRLSNMNTEIIIRIPLIPGVNDSDEDITAFSEILKTFGKSVKYVEVLKYNNLASSKYDILDMEYTSFADETQIDEVLDKYCNKLSDKTGIKCMF